VYFSAYLERRGKRNGGLHGDETRKSGSGYEAARRGKKSGADSIARKFLQTISNKVETSPTLKTLRELPIGARLLIRSKTDWRSAVVSRFDLEIVVLSVCSPSGRTYRLRRNLEAEIIFDGRIPILKIETEEDWRENFTKYDFRW
jgi:hypothetical protein